MMFELEGDALELLPMSEFGTLGLPVNTAAGVAPRRCQFWEDCTTNISECEFPTGTAWMLIFGESQ
jgi:hypothetical protein